MCSAANEPNYALSQCTADNELWLVYIYSTVPAGLRTALEDSVVEDFDSISGITGVVTTQSSGADVLVYYINANPNDEITYGTCSAGASYGLVNVRYHMWCKPQEIIYQNNADGNACWNFGPCRRHYACHELGHTLGLRHPVDLNRNDTCMSYFEGNNQPEDLRTHDINHLISCYPHPTMPLPTYPTETRTTSCKQ